MPAEIIDGKQIAKAIREEIKGKIADLVKTKGIQPGLATVLVGDNPASRSYVNSKRKACAELGIYSDEHTLPDSISQAELLQLIDQLNKNPKIHGILVQLPLPKQIDEKRIIENVSPKKDVDGFHPVNIGNLLLGHPSFVACTPLGILRLIQSTGISIKGTQAVVVGRSNIVGKPVAILLLAEHATVTICHSRTVDLGAVCREADILVVAIGKAKLITGDMVKPGAVVIDVGINRVNEKLVGDVDFESASKVAGYITPVPGGVGPMTIAMLMQNTLTSAMKSS